MGSDVELLNVKYNICYIYHLLRLHITMRNLFVDWPHVLLSLQVLTGYFIYTPFIPLFHWGVRAAACCVLTCMTARTTEHVFTQPHALILLVGPFLLSY